MQSCDNDDDDDNFATGLPLSPSVFGIDDKEGILMSRAGEGIELTP